MLGLIIPNSIYHQLIRKMKSFNLKELYLIFLKINHFPVKEHLIFLMTNFFPIKFLLLHLKVSFQV